ncbi:MAG TPA: uL15 family ribosomal protein [Thermoplasmata archaeon]|nr:uL15 family ribosomal protein [Thermoplasmata archaeon]
MVSRTKKLRGSRTHGRGKKHGRGAGGRGGTGNAGLHKHKFKWMIKYDPDHFGRHGFTRHAQMHETTAIDLEDLARRLPELESQGHVKRTSAGVDVDLTAAGIDKLLGSGRVGLALKITVSAASEQARAKVHEAGGQVLLPSDAKE